MKKIIVMLLMICSVFMITGCKPKEYTVTLKLEDGTVFEELVVEEKVSEEAVKNVEESNNNE